MAVPHQPVSPSVSKWLLSARLVKKLSHHILTAVAFLPLTHTYMKGIYQCITQAFIAKLKQDVQGYNICMFDKQIPLDINSIVSLATNHFMCAHKWTRAHTLNTSDWLVLTF